MVGRLGFTVKKTVRATEHDRADVAAARQQWRTTAPRFDPTRLVFLDESGIATDLIRRYGRSRRGTRLPDQAPHGRWQSHTFVAAVRLEGITAPGVIDGPIDGV